MNISSIICDIADLRPEGPAIIGCKGESFTWSTVARQIDVTKRDLRSFGIGANDRVLVVLPNGPVTAIAFLAISSAAIYVPMNDQSSLAEIIDYIYQTKSRAVIAHPEMARQIRAQAEDFIEFIELVPCVLKGYAFDLTSTLSCTDAADDLTCCDNVALILPTSGSTGKPKLVPLTHETLIRSAADMAESLCLSVDDRCLNLMPLFHVHGLVGGLLAPMIAGGSVICPENSHPKLFFSALERMRPTWYTAVPTMHNAIVSSAPNYERIVKHHTLKFIRSCSAPLASKLFHDLHHVFGVPVVEAYGMTEASHQVASNSVVPGRQQPNSVGVPHGNLKVAIIDSCGEFLGESDVGEIVISGPTVFSGYDSNEPANREAFIGEWFRTGDLGRIDRAGNIFIVGRLKDQINRGGEKISPAEIDAAILSYPGVAEVAVFGVSHPSLGQEVAAAIVVSVGSKVTDRELRDYLSLKLRPSKIPKRIYFVADLPKTASGKIQRRLVASKIEEAVVSQSLDQDTRGQDAGGELEKIIAIWSRLLNTNEPFKNDNFFESGGDSLLLAQLVYEIERHYGCNISLQDFLACPTLDRLMDIVEKTKIISFRLEATHEALVIIVPGIGGRTLETERLKTYLGINYRSLIVDYPTPEEIVTTDGSVKEITGLMLKKFNSIFSNETRFCLLGHSLGGTIAWQMAQDLSKQGKEIDFLGLIDSRRPCGINWKRGAKPADVSWLRWSIHLGFCKLPFGVLRLIGGMAEYSSNRLRSRIAVSLRKHLLARAAENYVPPNSIVRTALFRCSEHLDQSIDYGWRQYQPELKLVSFETTHAGIMQHPNFIQLCSNIEMSLRDVMRGVIVDQPGRVRFEVGITEEIAA